VTAGINHYDQATHRDNTLGVSPGAFIVVAGIYYYYVGVYP